MAPEVHSGTYSMKCDIFSLGMVLASLLMGCDAVAQGSFRRFRMIELIRAIEDGKRPEIDKLVNYYLITPSPLIL